MKTSNANRHHTVLLFLLFALSAVLIQVRCDEEDNDDTSVVNAADLGEDGFFPSFDDSIKCRDTEEYSVCDANPDCQRTCETVDRPGIPCFKRNCVEGCICKQNFVRDQLYGACIPEDQCGRVKH